MDPGSLSQSTAPLEWMSVQEQEEAEVYALVKAMSEIALQIWGHGYAGGDPKDDSKARGGCSRYDCVGNAGSQLDGSDPTITVERIKSIRFRFPPLP